MPADLICPGCGTSVPNADLLGMKVPGIYDGILVWTDQRCGHSWPRFEPDAGSGYSRLHGKAVEIIAGWDRERADVNPCGTIAPTVPTEEPS